MIVLVTFRAFFPFPDEFVPVPPADAFNVIKPLGLIDVRYAINM